MPECGITDMTGCMAAGLNAVFSGLVQAALSPILELLAATALSTPTIDQLPGIGELWQNSFGIVLAVYGMLILIGGIVVMSHESLQTRYSIKEIGPRIPVAFVASMLSLFFVDKLIRVANAKTLLMFSHPGQQHVHRVLCVGEGGNVVLGDTKRLRARQQVSAQLVQQPTEVVPGVTQPWGGQCLLAEPNGLVDIGPLVILLEPGPQHAT